jgi:hypothetical protein
MIAAGSFLLGEALALIEGVVKGSTLLQLTYSEINAYQQFEAVVRGLTGPYEYLVYLAMVVEIAAVPFAIAAIVTLSSRRTILHTTAVVEGLALVVMDVVASSYHKYLISQAMTKLPQLMSSAQLSKALGVQQRFDAAYGFWGSPAHYAILTILFMTAAAMFVGAVVTTGNARIWRPIAPAPIEIPETSSRTVIQENEERPRTATSPTKFCRYCGAKIPRQSKFCEECGKALAKKRDGT